MAGKKFPQLLTENFNRSLRTVCGQFLPELAPSRLTGATMVVSFFKMRGIYMGFRMQINANGRRFVTTPVRSMGIVL